MALNIKMCNGKAYCPNFRLCIKLQYKFSRCMKIKFLKLHRIAVICRKLFVKKIASLALSFFVSSLFLSQVVVYAMFSSFSAMKYSILTYVKVYSVYVCIVRESICIHLTKKILPEIFNMCEIYGFCII